MEELTSIPFGGRRSQKPVRMNLKDDNTLWRILIVDDDEDEYLLTRAMLAQAHWRQIELTWASNYVEGQRLLQNRRFDAVLVDYDLGSRTGIEFIYETVESGCSTPLILFTGRGSYEVDVEAMHAGATHYLTKEEASPLLLERIIRYAIERKQMEETMRRERELLEKVIENAPLGIAVVEGSELRYMLANPAYQAMQEHPETEMKGRIVAEALPQLALEGGDQYIRAVLLTARPNRVRVFQYRSSPARSPSYWDLDHLPLFDVDGQVHRVLILAKEITEQLESRRQVEAERSLLSAVLEQLPTGVFICEAPSGKVIRVNQTAHELFGGSLAEAKSVAEYGRLNAHHPDGRRYAADEFPLARSILKGEVVKDEEITFIFKDGTQKLVLASSAPVFNRQVQIIAGVFICDDISERKQLEEDLTTQTLALKNVHDAVIMVDPEQRITAWNNAAGDLYGWTAAEAIGRLLNDVLQVDFDLHQIQELDHWVAQTGSLTFETTHHTKDGRPLIVEGSTTTIQDADGKISGYLTTLQDITARKHAEEMLVKGEQKINEFLESIQDIFFVLDWNWCFSFLNEQAALAVSKSIEDLSGKVIWEVLPELKGGELEARFRAAMEQGQASEFQYLYHSVWYDLRVYPAKDGISVYALDITVRKQLEDRLAFHARIMQNVQDAIFVADQTHHITAWNQAAETMYGWTEEEAIGQVVGDLLGTEVSSQEREEIFREINARGSISIEIGQHTRSGKRMLVDSRIFAMRDEYGQVQAYVSANRDITDRKQVELALRDTLDALQKSESLLNLAHEAARLGSWTWKLGDTFTTCSETFFRIHGLQLSPDGRLDLGEYLSLIHPEDRERVSQLTYATLAGEYPEKVDDNEFRILLPDGVQRWMAAYQRALMDDEKMLGLTGVTMDVTERKLAQEAAHRSEEHIRSVFNSLFVYVAVLSPDGTVLDINIPPLEAAGINRTEVVGQHFADAPWWNYSAQVQEQLRRALQLAAAGETVRYDVQIRIAGDQRQYIDFMVAPMFDEQGQISFIIPSGVDISDRKRAERFLKHYTQRLERSNRDLEEFAFVASHDLLEPLRKISVFGQTLSASAAPRLDETEKDYLERMWRAADRMMSMLTDLLAYSRISSSSEENTRVDLVRLVEEVVSDLEVRLKVTGGRVEWQEELPVIEAVPSQMRRLFQNLIGNALKFHRPGEPPLVQVRSGAKLDGLVEIEIEDNGIGFEMDKLEIIFQPFQRLVNRKAYEGSGIGLSICRKIVERHGGNITARSVPGQGSTFIIRLPLSQ